MFKNGSECPGVDILDHNKFTVIFSTGQMNVYRQDRLYFSTGLVFVVIDNYQRTVF